MAKIFIDAGHGGSDPGASGNGLVEKVVNLNVATRVKYHLERHGVTVIMSRTTDTNPTLSQRSRMGNQNLVDASVSIHCNAFNSSVSGVETFTYGTKSNELRLAQCIHNEILSNKLYYKNRGIKQGNLHMTRELSMPAILVELAFIDNANDAGLLKNKQEEFAVAITTGILKYIGMNYKIEKTNQLYRIRKTWLNASLQKGAFHDLENAKKECDKYPGYSVFDESGNIVYTPAPKKEYVNLPSTASSWNVYPIF